MSKKRSLTPRQQEYADAIIGADLADRDMVEDAFRQRTEENEATIAAWGRALTRKRKEKQQEQLRRLQTQERCAYPGCSNSIQVERKWTGDQGMPEPTRVLTLTMQMEGWHWQGLSKAENTKTTTIPLWGCSPEHQEGIFRLEFELTPYLPIVGTDGHQIQYLMGDETQWKVYELARARAQELVAQASAIADLPRIRRTIQLLALREVEALIAASDPTLLTDDLEKFRTLYTQEFVEGYLKELRTRSHARGKKA